MWAELEPVPSHCHLSGLASTWQLVRARESEAASRFVVGEFPPGISRWSDSASGDLQLVLSILTQCIDLRGPPNTSSQAS